MTSVSKQHNHSVESLFSVLLFGFFVLFLLILLLFSSEAYRASVQGVEENNNLRTAMAYLTTKVRQHDGRDSLRIENFQGIQALAFQDIINDTEYTTYIYLDGEDLKELFTASPDRVSPSLGTVIASLKTFDLEEKEYGLWQISLTDTQDNHGSLLLHPDVPSA